MSRKHATKFLALTLDALPKQYLSNDMRNIDASSRPNMFYSMANWFAFEHQRLEVTQAEARWSVNK